MVASVFAINPIIEMIGQIAVIIICLYALIFVLVAVVFNVAASFGLAWVREKAELIKLLRPHVDSVNKASATSAQTLEPASSDDALARGVSVVPAKVHAVDQKVEQTTNRVANAVIEYRARSMQVKAIAKAFFLPGLTKKAASQGVDERGLEFNSPGYRSMMQEESVKQTEEPMAQAQGYRGSVTTDRLKNASSR